MAENKPIDDGGPAFPLPTEVSQNHFGNPDGYLGMSLRDWFAGQALAGLLANPDWSENEICHRTSDKSAVIVQVAYQAADAMLAARKEPRP